jgi:hypothetical protein
MSRHQYCAGNPTRCRARSSCNTACAALAGGGGQSRFQALRRAATASRRFSVSHERSRIEESISMDCRGVLWRKLNNINVMLISMEVYKGALRCIICSTVAILGSRGRASLTGICAGSATASSSHPGRSAWRAGSLPPEASGYGAARRRTPRLAPHSGSSLEHALNERGCESCSTASICSQ